MMEVCGDGRFEIIEKAKQAIIESTNIETSQEEMAVLDNILFRCWQMGWLDKYDNQQPDGDTISRQEAIEALADMHCKSDEDGYVWIIRSDAWARIDALPSVTPKRKTGKWIKQDCGGVEYTAVCSECGYGTFWRYALDFDFCPKCGSYNGGEQDE